MEKPRKYQLVIQVPIESMGDFDRLVQAEEKIREALKGTAQVHGHDSGTGLANLFIDSDAPQSDFQKALPCLDERVRDLAKAAYREKEDDPFTVLWPPGLKTFHVL